MIDEQQFDELWKAGCKSAILAIIRNHGKALTREQLEAELFQAIDAGLVGQAVTLAAISDLRLASDNVKRLVDNCLRYGLPMSSRYPLVSASAGPGKDYSS